MVIIKVSVGQLKSLKPLSHIHESVTWLRDDWGKKPVKFPLNQCFTSYSSESAVIVEAGIKNEHVALLTGTSQDSQESWRSRGVIASKSGCSRRQRSAVGVLSARSRRKNQPLRGQKWRSFSTINFFFFYYGKWFSNIWRADFYHFDIVLNTIMCVFMFVCMCICMSVCMYGCMSMDVCMYVCM